MLEGRDISITTWVEGHFSNWFTPHDQVGNQARFVVGMYDHDKDGLVDTGNEAELWRLAGKYKGEAGSGLLLSAADGGYAADSAGNNNGHVTVREVRNLMTKYDTGDPAKDNSASDHALTGVEWLKLLVDFGEKYKAPGALGQTDKGAWYVQFFA